MRGVSERQRKWRIGGAAEVVGWGGEGEVAGARGGREDIRPQSHDGSDGEYEGREGAQR